MLVANTVEARIVGTFEDKISAASQSVFNKMEAGMMSLAKIAAGIFAAHKIKEFYDEAIHAAREQEDATNRMNVALASVNLYTAKYSKELEDLAGQYQKNTVYGDEMIQGVFSQLLMFGAQQNQLKGLTDTVVNLAAGLRIDLASATDLVTKGLGGNFIMFSRYGIHINDALTQTEKMAELQRIVARRFGGLAAAEIDTYSGKIAQLTNAYGDFLEEVGNIVIKSPAMIQMLEEKKKGFEELTEVVKRNADYYVQLGSLILDVTHKAMKMVAEGLTPQSDAVIAARFSWEVFGRAMKAVEMGFDSFLVGAFRLRQAINYLAIPIANILDGFKSGKHTEQAMENIIMSGEMAEKYTRDVANAYKGLGTEMDVVEAKTKNVRVETVKAADEAGKFRNAGGSAGPGLVNKTFFDELIDEGLKVQSSLLGVGETVDNEVWKINYLYRTGAISAETYADAMDAVNLKLAAQDDAYAILVEKHNDAKSIIEATRSPLEKIAEEKKKILKYYELELIDAREMLDIQKDLEKRTREATLEQLKASQSLIDNMRYGLLSLRDDTNASGDLMQRTFKSVFGNIEQNISDMVLKGKVDLASLQSMINNIAEDLIKLTIRKTVTEPAAESLSNMLLQYGPTILGLFGLGATGGLGGETTGEKMVKAGINTETQYGPSPNLPGRASGGSVFAGRSYWVGEKGPEIFQPNTSGNIVATDKIRPGGDINIHMTVNTPDARSFQANQGEIMANLNRAMSRGQRNL